MTYKAIKKNCPPPFFRPRNHILKVITVLRHKYEIAPWIKTMSKERNQIETNGNVERVSVAAQSKKQIDNPMHTPPLEVELKIYGHNSDAVVTC